MLNRKKILFIFSEVVLISNVILAIALEESDFLHGWVCGIALFVLSQCILELIIELINKRRFMKLFEKFKNNEITFDELLKQFNKGE